MSRQNKQGDTSIYNYVVHSPIEPKRRHSDSKQYQYYNTLQNPVNYTSNRKNSIFTNSTINPEAEANKEGGESGISNRYIQFTPTQSKIYTRQIDPLDRQRATDTYKRIDYETSDKLTPQPYKPQKYFNQRWNDRQVHYEPSEIDKSSTSIKINDSKNDELVRLKRQNADLKRRLSLKQSCSCKAPYVQQQVQYMRHRFYEHIKTEHPYNFKRSQIKK